MDFQFYISFIAFILFLTISVEPKKTIKNKNIKKKIDNYKSQKFYENTYLYHIPNSRIIRDIKK